jgi:predicted small lipoprotein YifL
MIPSARFLTALATLLFTAACGLKGPLYLPDERKDEVAAPASEASDTNRATGDPQSPKKDRAPGERSEPSVSPPDPDRPADPPKR